MSSEGRIVSVNISTDKGTSKRSATEIVITDRGVGGDAHAGPWHRQVSLLSIEKIEAFAERVGREIRPGEFAENITTRGIDISTVGLMDRLLIKSPIPSSHEKRRNENSPPTAKGNSVNVELEVTQIGKACHGQECAIFREVGECLMPKEGIFCRVITGGTVRPGDLIIHSPRPLKFKIVTLSDRAYRGEYEDRSGPLIRKIIESFFQGKHWHPEIASVTLPDDPNGLRRELIAARDNETDIVLTTGGTGVGPRDFTPETVAAVCDKLIPGIMEHIRVKFGAENPNALLSRSVAGVAGTTLIYALPGSVKAVEEYMSEILLTMEHLILTIHGLDAH
ncbi:MAG: molybdopterin-binding protein [Armatimonadetes bacterium]|nr:molybdopterin-binding protein [Armatimonadota bacterium]